MYLACEESIVRKSALAFILNPIDHQAVYHGPQGSSCATSSPMLQAAPVPGPTLSPPRKTLVSSSASDEELESPVTSEDDNDDEFHAPNGPFSVHGQSLLSSSDAGHDQGKMRVRKSAICAQEGCPRAAVSRGRCVRHGGGSRCTFPNCTHGARLYNRCFHHGGCKICKVDGCTSKAKRYGYCWSHGGGHICDAEGCNKVAAPGGFCWAHGGGNRCRVEGCNRRSYQKHDYYCKQHTTAMATRS